MILAKQKMIVRQLTALAGEYESAARQRRRAYRRWKRETFGNLSALVWIFASGALWAASGRSGKGRSYFKRFMLSAANASLLAWRFAERASVRHVDNGMKPSHMNPGFEKDSDSASAYHSNSRYRAARADVAVGGG